MSFRAVRWASALGRAEEGRLSLQLTSCSESSSLFFYGAEKIPAWSLLIDIYNMLKCSIKQWLGHKWFFVIIKMECWIPFCVFSLKSRESHRCMYRSEVVRCRLCGLPLSRVAGLLPHHCTNFESLHLLSMSVRISLPPLRVSIFSFPDYKWVEHLFFMCVCWPITFPLQRFVIHAFSPFLLVISLIFQDSWIQVLVIPGIIHL